MKGRPRKEKRILSAFEASAPGTKKRPKATPRPTQAKEPIQIDSDTPSDSDISIEEPPTRRRRATSPTDPRPSPSVPDDDEFKDGFFNLDDPRFAEVVNMTTPAAAAAALQTLNTTKTPASKATTSKPPAAKKKPPTTANKKPTAPRGRIGKARKEEAMNNVVIALSAAGCPSNNKQITALKGDWLSNQPATSITQLLMAMTRNDATASKKQVNIITTTLNNK